VCVLLSPTEEAFAIVNVLATARSRWLDQAPRFANVNALCHVMIEQRPVTTDTTILRYDRHSRATGAYIAQYTHLWPWNDDQATTTSLMICESTPLHAMQTLSELTDGEQ
jgi:hypothetical protein